MWLASYLRLDDTRPAWAFAADVLISKAVTRAAGAIRAKAQINTFLQTWSPALGPKSALPKYLQRMFTTAKKHNVSFAAVKLSNQLKQELPMWYHLGALPELRRLNNSPSSDCLRNSHGILRVHELMAFCAHPEEDTLPTNTPCECDKCRQDIDRGCRDPARCRRAGRRLLALIRPKWNPTVSPTPDGLSMSKSAIERNLSKATDGTPVAFNPSVTDRTSVADAFRVFTLPHVHDFPPALRPQRGLTIEHEAVEVYIGWPPMPEPEGNTTLPPYVGLLFGPEDPRNRRIPTSREAGFDREHYELVAALVATRLATRDAPLTIIGTTDLLPAAFARGIPEWEDRGWIRVQHAPILRTLVSELRQRCARVHAQKASGQLDCQKSKQAGALCTDPNTNTSTHLETSLARNPAFDVAGARMTRLTQKLAYQGILDHATPAQRPSTGRTVERVQTHLNNVGIWPSQSEFWRSLRHKDIRRHIASFLWKVAHNAFKTGNFWLQVAGREDRARCQLCGATESIEHILTVCRAEETTTIWHCAKILWEAKGREWTPPSLEELLTIGMKKWYAPTAPSQYDHGTSRLWRILMSESIFMIWKLRCERVIQHSAEREWTHSRREVQLRWTAALQHRLQMDRTLTSPRFGRTAIPGKRVKQTWSGIVKNETALPGNWATSLRVLVGILPVSSEDPG